MDAEDFTLANVTGGELPQEESKDQLKLRTIQQETENKELREENAKLRQETASSKKEATQEDLSKTSEEFRFRPRHLMYIVALICLIVSIGLFVKSFSSPEYALSGLLMLAPTFSALFVGHSMGG